jgi:hypothetical protein
VPRLKVPPHAPPEDGVAPAVVHHDRGLRAGFGSEEVDQMEQTDYCRSKAAEYERRAQEATDERIRTFLYRTRDNWVEVAKDFERVGGVRRTTIKPRRT